MKTFNDFEKHINRKSLKIGDILTIDTDSGYDENVSYLGKATLTGNELIELDTMFDLRVENGNGLYTLNDSLSASEKREQYNYIENKADEYLLFSSSCGIEYLSLILLTPKSAINRLRKTKLTKKDKISAHAVFSKINRLYYRELYGTEELPDSLTGKENFSTLITE